MAYNSNIVFFDVETSGGNKQNCEILQLAGRCGNNVYSAYVQPTGSIHQACTDVHGISLYNGRLIKNGQYLPVKDLYSALLGFLQFLEQQGYQKVYLTAYNGVSMDFPLLYRDCRRNNLEDRLFDVVAGSSDTLAVLREKFGQGSLPSLKSLAQQYGVPVDSAHDATGDVATLQGLCYRLHVTANEIVRHAKHY